MGECSGEEKGESREPNLLSMSLQMSSTSSLSWIFLTTTTSSTSRSLLSLWWWWLLLLSSSDDIDDKSDEAEMRLSGRRR